jgi:hypothetical protein
MNIVKGFKRAIVNSKRIWKLYKEYKIYKDAHMSFFIKKVAEMDDFPVIFSGPDANIVFVEPSIMESLKEESNVRADNISDEMLKKYGKETFKVLSACASVKEGRPIIYICEENFRSELDRVTKHFKWLRGTIAAMTLLHEFWHYRQFQYLIEKGGFDLVNKVLYIDSLYDYGSSPLEEGAHNYGNSLGFKKQDFKELLPKDDNAIRDIIKESFNDIDITFMGKKIN